MGTGSEHRIALRFCLFNSRCQQVTAVAATAEARVVSAGCPCLDWERRARHCPSLSGYRQRGAESGSQPRARHTQE
jgi:hypothetical protein